MNTLKESYQKVMTKRRNRILIKIALCFLCIFLIIKWTVFVSSQYGNDTPINAIKTQVKDNDIGYRFINVFKSLFLEIEEVDFYNHEYIFEDLDFNKETQKVYQITKNVPHTTSGYWIVTEITIDDQKQYIAEYYGY